MELYVTFIYLEMKEDCYREDCLIVMAFDGA